MSISPPTRRQRLPGVLIVRPEAPMFFANVERMLAAVRHLRQAADEGCIR